VFTRNEPQGTNTTNQQVNKQVNLPTNGMWPSTVDILTGCSFIWIWTFYHQGVVVSAMTTQHDRNRVSCWKYHLLYWKNTQTIVLETNCFFFFTPDVIAPQILHRLRFLFQEDTSHRSLQSIKRESICCEKKGTKTNQFIGIKDDIPNAKCLWWLEVF